MAPRKYFEEIYEDLKKKIIAGDFPEGDYLPSVRLLREKYKKSHITVAKALRKLAFENYVSTFPGKGTIVVSRKPKESSTGLSSYHHNELKGKIVFIVFPSSRYPGPTQNSFAVFSGIQMELNRLGINEKVIVADDSDWRKMIISDESTLGIIFTQSFDLTFFQEHENSKGIPCILCNDGEEIHDIPAVFPNILAGTRILIKHIFEMGHKQISFVTIVKNDNHRFNLAGLAYREEMWNFSHPTHRIEWHINGYEHEIREVLERVKEKDPSAPTCLIISNDFMTNEILDEAKKMGLSIPEDISIATLNFSLSAESFSPPVTSVDTDVQTTGFEAVHLLLRMRKSPTKLPLVLNVPMKLNIRESIMDLRNKIDSD